MQKVLIITLSGSSAAVKRMQHLVETLLKRNTTTKQRFSTLPYLDDFAIQTVQSKKVLMLLPKNKKEVKK
jgi:hypothetical protein